MIKVLKICETSSAFEIMSHVVLLQSERFSFVVTEKKKVYYINIINKYWTISIHDTDTLWLICLNIMCNMDFLWVIVFCGITFMDFFIFLMKKYRNTIYPLNDGQPLPRSQILCLNDFQWNSIVLYINSELTTDWNSQQWWSSSSSQWFKERTSKRYF